MTPSQKDLVDAAIQARATAYAPYSGYAVGAAVRSKSGRIYCGCNVENVSYGLCLCAERNAVAAMVAAGETEIAEIAIVTADGGTPCGMCRQVLQEFSSHPESTQIVCATPEGVRESFTLDALLPSSFASREVRRSI